MVTNRTIDLTRIKEQVLMVDGVVEDYYAEINGHTLLALIEAVEAANGVARTWAVYGRDQTFTPDAIRMEEALARFDFGDQC